MRRSEAYPRVEVTQVTPEETPPLFELMIADLNLILIV